jgi:hypothetical protein
MEPPLSGSHLGPHCTRTTRSVQQGRLQRSSLFLVHALLRRLLFLQPQFTTVTFNDEYKYVLTKRRSPFSGVRHHPPPASRPPGPSRGTVRSAATPLAAKQSGPWAETQALRSRLRQSVLRRAPSFSQPNRRANAQSQPNHRLDLTGHSPCDIRFFEGFPCAVVERAQ